MTETIYVPRGFFTHRVIMNDVWLSNHHFLIRLAKVRNVIDFSNKERIHAWGDGEFEGDELITSTLKDDGEHGMGKIWASLCESHVECRVSSERLYYGAIDRAVVVKGDGFRAFLAESYVDAFGLDGITLFGSMPDKPLFNAKDEKKMWLAVMPLNPKDIDEKAKCYNQRTGRLNP